ncbi:MAG: hypothetical protein M1815_003941 [Lichina confinis]|nr:MAG: hypothetical protein M1815_003941 [Lichina confinis]
MARDSTNAGSSTGQTTDSRYRSVNSSQDPHGRETGNYETFPVAEQGLGPPTPVPPPGRKRDRTGAEVPEISLTNAIRSLTWEDVKKLPHQRCVRDALLTGMISGFLVGGARAILGGSIARASHWAVGAFACGSVGAHEYCQYTRHREVQNMQKAVEVVSKKRKRSMEDNKRLEAELRMLDAQERARKASEGNGPRRRSWFWASPEPPDRPS